jgi:hypothetical protein
MLPAVVILTGVLVYAPILAWLLLQLDATRQRSETAALTDRGRQVPRAAYHLPRELIEHDAA